MSNNASRPEPQLHRWAALFGVVVYYIVSAVSRASKPQAATLADLTEHGAVTLLALLVIVALWLWSMPTGGRSELGFPPQNGRAVLKAIAVGVLWGAVGFVTLTLARSVLQSFIGSPNVPSVFAATLTADNLPLWLGISWLAGGIREELLRVLTVVAFHRAFGRWGLGLGVLIQALLFGLGHARQGAVAATVIGCGGLALGALFVKRKNLLELVVAHGVYDSVGVLLATFVLRS